MKINSFNKISAKYISLCKNTEGSAALTEAEEWLSDNFYIIEKCAKETQKSLSSIKRSNVRKKLLYDLAKEFLNSLNGAADGGALCDFLETKQEKSPLSCDELWLFPAFLNYAAIDMIAALCGGDMKNGDKMGKLIAALVSVGDIDFEESFEKLCATDKVFNGNTKDFSLLCDETKAQYRKTVSYISQKSGKSEAEVAKTAVALALKGKNEREKHVGYYLVGNGVKLLYDAVGLKMRRNPASVLYPSCIVTVSALILVLLFAATKSAAVVLVSLLPAVDIAHTLSNYIFSRAISPKPLPRLKLDDGAPENGKTMIVYPVLLSSQEAVDEICEKLEVCRVANREKNLYFALLGDFKDGDAKDAADDEEIIGRATEKILRLNEKYADTFYLFIRNREYSSAQQKWMGKERKRGALTSLCGFLRGEDDSFPVFMGDRENIRDIKYLITLDSDTVLPIGGAGKLIGAAMHPLNRPVIDEKLNIVTEGYGIIKPKICIDTESASKSVFSRIYAGAGGTDSYSTAESDIYMDIFGEAIFTGKGIFDIDAFLRCTKKAIPDNTVLSHDLLEGSYLRCALCFNAEVYDSYPSAFQSFVKRQHRWIRGDWQLLPWLGSNVFLSDGAKTKNPLSKLSKWKIFDNLRRSFMPVLLFLILAFPYWFDRDNTHILSPFAALALVLPLLLYCVSSIISGGFKGGEEKRYADIIVGLRASFYQTVLSISFLAFHAYLSADAILRTLARVIFTKKNTLQWVTAADAERGKAKTFFDYYKFMAPSVYLGAAAFLESFVMHREYMGVALVLGIIWAAAPMIAFFISMEEKTEGADLSARSREFLMETAQRTWKFFDEYTVEQENFLPPDNLQLRPFKGAAHRTSPTNIGLYMLSVLGARDLGFIDTDEMEKRLSRTIETIEKLEKWRGHLLNWYDTRTLKPLYPRYVSTVDSGNFVCYLMTVCKGVAEYGGGKSENLIMRMKKIIDEARFGILYDKNKKLFHIGYNIEENSFSSSYYDMLESEARQTCFLSVARGEVKPAAWFRLSRTLTASDGYKGLASWTGTMFEYFMPLILMRSYKNTLLDESLSFALQCQKKYGKKRRIPWGVSESGFYSFDSSMNYQYKAFGVPGLGLKRGLSGDCVIAPYASLLTLLHDERSSLLNLLRLKRMGLFGDYGFFEAADFTPSRVPDGEKYVAVKSYMAHHQGMGFAAIVNVLCGNTMQKRFEKWPEIRAALPLLQEKVPVGVSVKGGPHERISHVKTRRHKREMCVREFEGEYTLPPVHALSNGVYSVLIDNRGCGVSSYGNINLNRKRPSPDENGRGIMILIKTEDGDIISAYEGKCVFSSHMAEYHTKHKGIESNLAICVLPEESAEERRITLVNKSGKTQQLEVMAFTDISLSTYEAEISHSAFAGLFVETFFEDGSLFAQRHPQNEKDIPFAGFMAARSEGDSIGGIQFDTDRAALLSGGDVLLSLKEKFSSALSGAVGNVLDPCFAMRMRFEIKNGESASADFLFGISEQMSDAKRAARRFKEKKDVLFFEESYKSEALRPLKLCGGEEKMYLDALSQLYFKGAATPMQQKSMRENSLPYRELWKLGISGTKPVVTLEIFDLEDKEILEQALKAHEFWRYKGIVCDLIILCNETAGYNSPVKDMASEMARGHGDGVFILSGSETDGGDRNLLIAASSLYIDGKSGLENALIKQKKKEKKEYAKSLRNDTLKDIPCEFENGLGGFGADGAEYVINQKRSGDTPAPWCNVLANENFGTLLTESGGGFTWYKNSREMRLSDWRNDAASDILQEKLIIKDSGGVWSPQAGALCGTGEFTAVHGVGYTEYRRYGDIDCEMRVFVPPEDSVKIITAKIRNNTEKETDIEAVYSVVPVIGVNKYETRGRHMSYVTDYGVICKNIFEKSPVVFLFTGGENGAVACDSGEKMTDSCGEPISIYAKNTMMLQRGEEKEICFLFGAADSEKKAAETVLRYKDSFKDAFEDMKKWRGTVSSLQLDSGQKQIDFLFNNWLLYQVTSCRLWGRSAFYQSGGAYGFRDQLQDTLPLLYSRADLAKKQILKAAAHQFPEGDALHWWHEGKKEKGVRTRFSDDRLWLPFVTAEYISVTGDFDILNEKVPFVEGAALQEGQNENYFEIDSRTERESVYVHCKRAIDISMRLGKHGLPLMGSGDWNDGMNAVGVLGRGESVWLCWFLRDVLLKFAPLCKKMGDTKTTAFYEKCAEDLKANANNAAWDGDWFLRAFFDDGTPMGSAANNRCRIDSISQSWAVISRGTDKERAKRAVKSAADILVDDTHGIVKLLAPPFSKDGKSPGYIASYPEGVRENGGQYTHAAVWLAISAAMLGDGDTAWKIAQYINPVNHTKSDILANTYKTEGYVLAADVYSAEGKEGRGGWTWYTGAAAWYYKLLAEYIFGFKKCGDTVKIKPCLPSFMKSFKMTYTFFETEYIFDVSEGEKEENTEIKLVNDKKAHEIKVIFKKQA